MARWLKTKDLLRSLCYPNDEEFVALPGNLGRMDTENEEPLQSWYLIGPEGQLFLVVSDMSFPILRTIRFSETHSFPT